MANKVEFFFLRPKDIAIYVGSGELDFGITGRDLARESQAPVRERLDPVYSVPEGISAAAMRRWVDQALKHLPEGDTLELLPEAGIRHLRLPGLRELRRPGDVEGHHVQRRVAAGDAAAPSALPLRMSCQLAMPLAAQAADTVLAHIEGGQPRVLNPASVGQCISLGRHAGTIQLSRFDDTAIGLHIGGRLAATIKESAHA